MRNPIFISFGSGKGGVGKSTIVSNFGALLSRKNYSIGFIDADLGGANLHLCVGVKRPRYSLQDFLSGRIDTLHAITEETAIPNSWLISGASGILELANPHFTQKQKIINNLKKMDADYILADLGAGTNSHVTDFFIAFNNGVVISDCLPTSIENAYGFLKNGIIRGVTRLFPGREDLKKYFRGFSDPNRTIGFATISEMLSNINKEFPQESLQIKEWLAQRKTFLILNMVKTQNDIAIGKRFIDIIKKYLTITVTYIGYIIDEPEIRRSIREMRPLVMDNPSQEVFSCFNTITENLLGFL